MFRFRKVNNCKFILTVNFVGFLKNSSLSWGDILCTLFKDRKEHGKEQCGEFLIYGHCWQMTQFRIALTCHYYTVRKERKYMCSRHILHGLVHATIQERVYAFPVFV